MAKREFLAKGKVVSASQWRHEYSHGRHEYSHVAFGDRTGRLTLCDRAVLRCLARPGGLASLGVAGQAQDIPRALLRGGVPPHRSGGARP